MFASSWNCLAKASSSSSFPSSSFSLFVKIFPSALSFLPKEAKRVEPFVTEELLNKLPELNKVEVLFPNIEVCSPNKGFLSVDLLLLLPPNKGFPESKSPNKPVLELLPILPKIDFGSSFSLVVVLLSEALSFSL